jgi:ribosome-associated heat shock protein Hsp15
VAGPGARPDPASAPRLRLDKWLWHARFFKGRDLAVDLVTSGHCRVNGQPCRKPGHGVTPGDVLTFPQGARIRVVRILALGQRRGPAAEAQVLYDDLDPAPEPEQQPLE